MSEERIEIKLKPIRKLWYDDVSSNGGYSCETYEEKKVQLSTWGNFLIKGTLPELLIGFEYNAILIEKEDKRGIYYEPQSIFEDIPSDPYKQRLYLQEIIPESQVNALFKAYPNSNMIDLIQNDELDVSKVKGVGKKTLNKIKERIERNIEFREAFEFLGQYQIKPNFIIRLVKYFKSSKLTVEKIKESPYNLLVVPGIGFKTADNVAKKMDFPMDSQVRIKAAIQHIVEENEKEGNTYIITSDLIDEVYKLTGIDTDKIESNIADTEELLVLGDRIALRRTFNAEKFVANKLKEVLSESKPLNFDVEKFIEQQENELNMKLTEQQKQLFYNLKEHSVNLLVGFAGCGKSQMQKLVINLLEQLGMTYLLLSPTGKAAKVMSGYTEREAITIHRAYLRHTDPIDRQPIDFDYDFIIVDESSMVDIRLASQILVRVKKGTRLLFIGDSFQIPSVNAGLFLHDCIESKVIPTTFLNVVFRQKEGGIMDVVTKMRLKEKFINNDDLGIFRYGDNCVIASVPQDKMEGGYKYYFNDLIKTYQPEDVMVLSPTKKGNLGTYAINETLQGIVNPSETNKEELKYGKKPEVTFREKDYVINTQNSYRILNVDEQEVDIVNGDIGYIEKIDKEQKELIIDFDFDKIPLSFRKLNQLLHSWCITLHKSQGSGSRAVIMVLDKAHKFQLNANLIYTGASRSKDFLVIITQAETLNYAMRKNANMERKTFLRELLVSDGVNG